MNRNISDDGETEADCSLTQRSEAPTVLSEAPTVSSKAPTVFSEAPTVSETPTVSNSSAIQYSPYSVSSSPSPIPITTKPVEPKKLNSHVEGKGAGPVVQVVKDKHKQQNSKNRTMSFNAKTKSVSSKESLTTMNQNQKPKQMENTKQELKSSGKKPTSNKLNTASNNRRHSAEAAIAAAALVSCDKLQQIVRFIGDYSDDSGDKTHNNAHDSDTNHNNNEGTTSSVSYNTCSSMTKPSVSGVSPDVSGVSPDIYNDEKQSGNNKNNLKKRRQQQQKKEGVNNQQQKWYVSRKTTAMSRSRSRQGSSTAEDFQAGEKLSTTTTTTTAKKKTTTFLSFLKIFEIQKHNHRADSMVLQQPQQSQSGTLLSKVNSGSTSTTGGGRTFYDLSNANQITMGCGTVLSRPDCSAIDGEEGSDKDFLEVTDDNGSAAVSRTQSALSDPNGTGTGTGRPSSSSPPYVTREILTSRVSEVPIPCCCCQMPTVALRVAALLELLSFIIFMVYKCATRNFYNLEILEILTGLALLVASALLIVGSCSHERGYLVPYIICKCIGMLIRISLEIHVIYLLSVLEKERKGKATEKSGEQTDMKPNGKPIHEAKNDTILIRNFGLSPTVEKIDDEELVRLFGMKLAIGAVLLVLGAVCLYLVTCSFRYITRIRRQQAAGLATIESVY